MSIFFLTRNGTTERALNFAKSQITSVKRTKNNERIKIIEIPMPDRFPVEAPRVRVRLPRWSSETDFDIVEIGKVILKGVKNRQTDQDDRSDQLISELKQGSNRKPGRAIINDEDYDLNEILEEFRDDQE